MHTEQITPAHPASPPADFSTRDCPAVRQAGLVPVSASPIPFDREAAESRYAESSRRQADERYWERERYGVDRRTGA